MKTFYTRIGLLLLVCAFPIFGQATKTVFVFDGRPAVEESSTTTAAEEKFIEKEVRRKETIIKAKAGVECDEETFGVSGAASGSFTKAKAAQKIFLYELCRSGRSFGIGGIVVVENEKVVAHRIFGENGLRSDIKALPDINKNGLSEIVLGGYGTGQGYTEGAVEIIELTAAGVKSFGFADIYEDDFGANENDPSATAYKITAQTGKIPVFFREAYTRKSEEDKWILSKKAQKFTLRKDTAKYNSIK